MITNKIHKDDLKEMFDINYYQRISMDSSTNDTVTLQLKFENGSIGTSSLKIIS